VFKVIKDFYPPPKETTRADQGKYLLVKHHDRVGRMADTLEYSNVAFPRTASRTIWWRAEAVRAFAGRRRWRAAHHQAPVHRAPHGAAEYVADRKGKRRSPAGTWHVEYGNAIKELVAANIFPGDMLYKNFGVTRHQRVVFYDYDEIEYITDCQFRAIPQAAQRRRRNGLRAVVPDR
jgi:isocitrate dehydrogenase kinase/phosphatase